MASEQKASITLGWSKSSYTNIITSMMDWLFKQHSYWQRQGFPWQHGSNLDRLWASVCTGLYFYFFTTNIAIQKFRVSDIRNKSDSWQPDHGCKASVHQVVVRRGAVVWRWSRELELGSCCNGAAPAQGIKSLKPSMKIKGCAVLPEPWWRGLLHHWVGGAGEGAQARVQLSVRLIVTSTSRIVWQKRVSMLKIWVSIWVGDDHRSFDAWREVKCRVLVCHE
jgi:hypothetical protein